MSQFSSGRHAKLSADPYPLTNPMSWALRDVREYRAQRLTMNNPKGWGHVRRVFEQAVGSGFYSEYEDHDEMVAHARKVLTRLKALEDS